MTDDLAFRTDVLARFGASDEECAELLAYNENVFDHNALVFVAEDEGFVEKWRRYAVVADQVGVAEVLRQKLMQFKFPIREGISQTPAYRQATLRGLAPLKAEGLALEAPERLHLEVHPTPAGHIPLLITDHRADFVTLIRALTRRNEPVPIPDSMGACMVAGYNNWDRIQDYRRRWEQSASDTSEQAWARAFKTLVPQKDRYQDRFIILSDGPYSAVPAEALGLPEPTWRHLSLIIRREHECAHYFTRRVLGSMRNNILDELIADYMGVTGAAGQFHADWFLHFMGLEAAPTYRSGGRLENYRGNLSEGAFVVLQRLVVKAARHLEHFSTRHGQRFAHTEEKAVTLITLSRMTLEGLASDAAADLLEQAWVKTCEAHDRAALVCSN